MDTATVGDEPQVLLALRGGEAEHAAWHGVPVVGDLQLAGLGAHGGLAANGQAGVENVLDILRSGIDSALLGLGHSDIHHLTPNDLVIPNGFTTRLGDPNTATS